MNNRYSNKSNEYMNYKTYGLELSERKPSERMIANYCRKEFHTKEQRWLKNFVQSYPFLFKMFIKKDAKINKKLNCILKCRIGLNVYIQHQWKSVDNSQW